MRCFITSVPTQSSNMKHIKITCSHCNLRPPLKGKDLCSSCTKRINTAQNIIDMEEDPCLNFNIEPCIRCKIVKPKTTTYYRTDNLSTCKQCRNSYDPSYRREHIRELMLQAAKRRAKLNNLEFSLTLDDLNTLPEICPVLGIPMTCSLNTQEDNSWSLDRIDNNKGYVPGNVSIISWRANKLKSDATPNELRLVLAYVDGRV